MTDSTGYKPKHPTGLSGREIGMWYYERTQKRLEGAKKAQNRKTVSDKIWHLYCLKMQHNPPDEAAVRLEVKTELELNSMAFVNTAIEEHLSKIGAPIETIGERHLLEALHGLLEAQTRAKTELEAQIIKYEEVAERDEMAMVTVEQTTGGRGAGTKEIPVLFHLRGLYKELVEVNKHFIDNVSKLTPRSSTTVLLGNSNSSTMSDQDLERAIQYERVKLNLAIPVEPEEVSR